MATGHMDSEPSSPPSCMTLGLSVPHLYPPQSRLRRLHEIDVDKLSERDRCLTSTESPPALAPSISRDLKSWCPQTPLLHPYAWVGDSLDPAAEASRPHPFCYFLTAPSPPGSSVLAPAPFDQPTRLRQINSGSTSLSPTTLAPESLTAPCCQSGWPSVPHPRPPTHTLSWVRMWTWEAAAARRPGGGEG